MRKNLTLAQRVALADFIRAEYVKADTFDNKFAVMASEQLKFPVATRQVLDTRNALGIPPTKPRRIEKPEAPKSDSVLVRLVQIKSKLTHLIAINQRLLDEWSAK